MAAELAFYLFYSYHSSRTWGVLNFNRVNKPMKIGLIAMSGVRAYNEELLRFGLTLPGFVERSKVIASLPSLSLLTLAALTAPEVQVEYWEIKDLIDQDGLPTDFDLVAISSFSAQIYDAYQIADRCRKRGIAVVMGGLHVTSLPEEAREHCTSIVVVEGEELWPGVGEDFFNDRLQDSYVQPPCHTFERSEE